MELVSTSNESLTLMIQSISCSLIFCVEALTVSIVDWCGRRRAVSAFNVKVELVVLYLVSNLLEANANCNKNPV
jgi:hypothetical protein